MLSLLALSVPALGATWPADAAWIPVELDGSPMTDPCGDESGSSWWDIVGDESDPAGFWHDDGTNLWFRLRVHDEPYSSHAWRAFGWGVMIESDWAYTAEKYDYIVYVDGNSDEVTLSENTIGTLPFTDDAPELDLATWAAPLAESDTAEAGNAGWSVAPSDICGGTEASADYFLDWYVPLDELALLTGITDTSTLGFVLGTSASTNKFSKDCAGADDEGAPCGGWYDTVSDTDTDSDGDGLTDTDEGEIGSDPHSPDTDGGGVDDGDEVDAGTDPTAGCDDYDTDCDGLTDDEEAALGTDPNDADTDDGGVSDGDEVDNGTDPLNPCDDFDRDCDGLTDDEEAALGTDPNDADTDDGGVSDGDEVDNGTNPLEACDDFGVENCDTDPGDTDTGGDTDPGDTDIGDTDPGDTDGGGDTDVVVDEEVDPRSRFGAFWGGCGGCSTGNGAGAWLPAILAFFALRRRSR